MAAAFRAPDFNFKHVNTENGLPSNRVRDIAQDNDGFMWFATDGGLVRFDGKVSKIFIPVIPERPEEDVYVMTLCKYRDGLVVGTDKGLFGYDPVNERLDFLPVRFTDGRIGRINGTVISVAADSNENIWASVDKEGIYKIAFDGSLTARYRFPEVDDYLVKVYIDNADLPWALANSSDGYLYKYDLRESAFRKFPISVNGDRRDRSGSAIMCDPNGDYWLGTWDEGLIRFNGRTGEGVSYGVPSWHVHSITPYSPSLLFVGSDNGLMLFDINSGEYCVYVHDELAPDGMSGSFVYPVTRDSEGGFWIGTFYRGVNYLSKGSARFNKWQHSRFTNSVAGNVISRLCEDNEGNIWIGSADGGLSKFDVENRLFTRYPVSAPQESDNINALCVDGNRLWVGTYSKGTGFLDMKSGKWNPVNMENEEATSSYAIFRDSEGRIWTGVTQNFALYNPERNVFEKISDLKAWINDIDQDSNGDLWISTQGAGLFRYEPEGKRWKNYRSDGTKGSIPHNHINSVLIADGRVLIATPKGVSVFDSASDVFYPLNGFPEGSEAYAIEKSGDDFWVSTKMGLLCVHPDGKVNKYTAADGLADNQFLPGASLSAADGTLYFGSVYGFSGVNPQEVRVKGHPPMVKFTGLDIVNDPVSVGDPHLPVSLNNLKQLELDNSDHTFTIYFSALSYANPDENQYQYRLEGFDKAWHNSDHDRGATYSNLPPGSYIFRVKAANSDGVWNDEGASLRIVVKPIWYMTTLMKLLYLVIAIGLILLVVRYILWQMEKSHRKELDRVSDNQEKEMFRSKLSFFTVVAHEIRTPVSLIIGPLEKVLSSNEKFSPQVRDDLNVIDRNARRLLSLVNQLLDFKKVEDNSLPLGFRHIRIVPLIESIVSRFRPSMEQKGISLSVDLPDPDMEVDVDPEAVTKLVSNLLNNAMKFTRNYIRVSCQPVPDSGMFRISVADNGIGISKENQDKVFRPFFQVLDNINEAKGGTGLGLSIVRSVVEAHGGEIQLESNPGEGAKFIILLPVRQKDTLPAIDPQAVSPDSGDEELLSPDDYNEPVGEDPVLLVVDDNEEMVKFISGHFEKNYEVVTASNGREALDKMKEKNVALIICDWMMPVMDGEEFLRKIRNDENYSHIPFVMLTAKTDNSSKITSMKSGADAYVEKPFSISYLDARIENLLEMRALLRKKYSQSPLEPLSTIAQSEVDNEFLSRLQAVIEENFSNPQMSVDFLAEHLGISRSGLYAKIKSLADVTPNELIQITRLKKAAELLSQNKYRINEICYMVGFNSSSYFARCFQKQFGLKPNEFAARR